MHIWISDILSGKYVNTARILKCNNYISGKGYKDYKDTEYMGNKTEKEKMIAGELYDAYEAELCELRNKCRKSVIQLNSLDNSQQKERCDILEKLLGKAGKNAYILNAQFDYGFNTYIGDEFSANFNFVVLDCAPVHIGNYVMIGPNVTIATPMHPLVAKERNFQVDENGVRHLYEYAKPIIIGNNVWIASNVVVTGGVTIGDNCVIGAGSVVTRDIPPNSFAVGVPCRVIRKITDDDCIMTAKEL